MRTNRKARMIQPGFVFVVLLSLITSIAPPQLVIAQDTPDPGSVTIAGSLQSELGCSGDWQADCAITHLTYDAEDDVWQAS